MYPWELFFKESIIKIFSQKKTVVDIGGGLRVLKEKNNRYDPRREWIRPYISQVDYKIMDPVPDFNPDIVGDIHKMPFENNSLDALICLAVLEHVENPILAFAEMHRTLKPGGYCLIYVPFLFYYHAEKGYYKDYWRFTKDTLEHLSKPFKEHLMVSVRGSFATWLHLSPFGRLPGIPKLAFFIDKIFGKLSSNQTSGYYLFLVK